MKILFYQEVIAKSGVISDRVHIIEVLNHLTSLGHTIIYANGEPYSVVSPSEVGLTTGFSRRKSGWQKFKEYILSQYFRGEALVIFYIFKEIAIFPSAFSTILRNKPDLIYRRHNMFHGEYMLSRIFKIPCVTEVNGIIAEEVRIQPGGDRFSLWLINSIEKQNFLKADKYIVVTRKMKELLCSCYKMDEEKTVVIENGANTDIFKPSDQMSAKEELNLRISDRYICYSGGLTLWQGIDYLISAMPYVLKEFPNARALIIGEGTVKDELLQLSNDLGVSDKVLFPGKIAYGKVPSYINASDICVVPKKPYKAGYSPLKLCEYMACGKPVVASKTDGFELLEENNAGLLVNPQDSREFALAIISLLRDPGLCQRMGENGREYVLKNRSWESVAKKVCEVCQNCIKDYYRDTKKS